MKKLLVMLCVCGLVAPVFGAGQPAGMSGIKAGEKELSGSFSVMSASGGDADMGATWMLIGSAGYFISDNVQLKGTGLIFGNSGGSVDMMNGSIGAGADYLFQSGMDFIPYVGGDLLISFSKVDMQSDYDYGEDSSTTDTSLGFDIHAGLKQFIADHIALNYELRYQMDSSDSGIKWLIFTIGLNVYLE